MIISHATRWSLAFPANTVLSPGVLPQTPLVLRCLPVGNVAGNHGPAIPLGRVAAWAYDEEWLKLSIEPASSVVAGKFQLKAAVLLGIRAGGGLYLLAVAFMEMAFDILRCKVR